MSGDDFILLARLFGFLLLLIESEEVADFTLLPLGVDVDGLDPLDADGLHLKFIFGGIEHLFIVSPLEVFYLSYFQRFRIDLSLGLDLGTLAPSIAMVRGWIILRRFFHTLRTLQFLLTHVEFALFHLQLLLVNWIGTHKGIADAQVSLHELLALFVIDQAKLVHLLKLSLSLLLVFW